ncbi:hypothetical protein [Paraburkholderia sp. BL10I2N1]|uniref:hypothetical protein n=1 Tax=Paraburkholderia sp. BL10I2N1 TaxID=1938796 RepID=UPI00106172D5|nr:hypothetical protein [Paraburkholderia sp. BL10I2N1]TDN59166.1 hypothetical protein B0G77_8364 [Paraburkholderia sp. BL10I2N1]
MWRIADGAGPSCSGLRGCTGAGRPFLYAQIEIREMLADGSIDILGKFGDLCHAEFASLRAQQF